MSNVAKMGSFISILPRKPSARVLATNDNSAALPNCLKETRGEVAEEYPGVTDLTEAGISDSDIAKTLIETENVRWMEHKTNTDTDYA